MLESYVYGNKLPLWKNIYLLILWILDLSDKGPPTAHTEYLNKMKRDVWVLNIFRNKPFRNIWVIECFKLGEKLGKNTTSSILVPELSKCTESTLWLHVKFSTLSPQSENWDYRLDQTNTLHGLQTPKLSEEFRCVTFMSYCRHRYSLWVHKSSRNTYQNLPNTYQYWSTKSLLLNKPSFWKTILILSLN